jgi:hypothetical protein
LNIEDVQKMAKSLPKEVPFKEIVDFENLDVRVGCVNVFFANIVGVNKGFIGFSPNSDPPSCDELLAWLWLVRPDLTSVIADQIKNSGFREGIRHMSNVESKSMEP